MNEYAKMCRDNMRKGIMPPHNWQCKVSKYERRKIYDAWVDWYLDQVRSGNKLPGRGTSSCINALTDDQRERLYKGRGFGSTANMCISIKDAIKKKEDEKRKHDFLKCHGGQHTQDVMKEASEARKRRKNHIYRKSCEKKRRRMIAKGFEHCPRSYNDYCSYMEISARANSWSKIRNEIIELAKRTNDRYMRLWAIEKTWGNDNDFVKMFRNAGIDNLEKLILIKMPGFYGSTLFKAYRPYLIGKNLLDVLYYVWAWSETIRLNECSSEIERFGSTKTSDAHAQLRALGFVA